MNKLKNWIYDNETLIMVYGLIGGAAVAAMALGAATADVWSNGHINWTF